MNLTRLADNDFSDFERPEHYIRHIGSQLLHALPNYSDVRICITEPLESELAVQVEYDMDEQGSITLSFSQLSISIAKTKHSQTKNGWMRSTLNVRKNSLIPSHMRYSK